VLRALLDPVSFAALRPKLGIIPLRRHSPDLYLFLHAAENRFLDKRRLPQTKARMPTEKIQPSLGRRADNGKSLRRAITSG
jgi:hypothetical protein